MGERDLRPRVLLESCWPDSSRVIDRVLPEATVPARDRERILHGHASRIYGLGSA